MQVPAPHGAIRCRRFPLERWSRGGIRFAALLGSDKVVVVDARDLFIKGDRHIESSEGRSYVADITLSAPAVTGGPPPGGEFVLKFSQIGASELVRQYLTFHDPARVSSLLAILRDARGATGRSEETGQLQPEQEGRAGHWLGALGYMVTIEQIGKCFRPRGATPQLPPGFRRALADFAPHLTKQERDALYALRCCFAHDYSLVNGPGKRTPQGLWHRFNLTARRADPIGGNAP